MGDTFSGMTMGKLGDHKFYMHNNEYKKITDTINAEFKSVDSNNGLQRLYSQPKLSRTIKLNGVLVRQSEMSLKNLQADIRIGAKTRFTTFDDDIDCVITSLEITKKSFLHNGRAMVQEYNISLKEVLEDLY